MAANSIRLDQSSIRSLHFIDNPPLNHRDASLGTKKSRTEWKEPATPIVIPTNTMFNPYTTQRMGNNLNGSTGKKRPTNTRHSKRTPEGPSKRQKTFHNSLLIANEPQPDISNNHSEPSYRTRFNQAPAERTDVMKGEASTSQIGTKPLVIISDSDDDVEDIQDGENIIWLKDDLKSKRPSPNHSSQTSTIDDFPVGERKRPVKKGFVQGEVEKLERTAATVGAMGKNVIDLRTVKTNMKPNTRNHLRFDQVQTRNKDPIATSSTRFKVPQRKGFKVLPLKALYMGYKLFEEGYRVDFKSIDAYHFSILGPGNFKEDATFAQVVKSIEFGTENAQEPCIRFSTKPIPPRDRHKGIGQHLEADVFQAGESGIGHVTLKFDKKNPAWSMQTYREFKLLCKRKTKDGDFSEVLGENSVRSLWSTAHQAAGGVAALAEEDSLNIRDESVQFGDSFELDQLDELPVSNERNRKDEEPHLHLAQKAASTSRQSSSTPETNISTSVPRRSARQQQQQQVAPPKQPSVDPDEIMLSYQPATTGALKITYGDFKRLAPNEYLNDTLIEFGLRLWHTELTTTNPDLASQIHIFNSFFYKKLNKRNSDEGYQSVRRWTSKFDIFEKRFVIVPINENMHWYLAIIYRPDLVLIPPLQREPPNTRARSSNAQEELAPGITADIPLSPSVSTSNEANAGSPDPTPGTYQLFDPSKPSSEADVEEVQRLTDAGDDDGLTDMVISVDVKDLNAELNFGHPSPPPSPSIPDAETMDVDDEPEKEKVIISFSKLTTSPSAPVSRTEHTNVNNHQGTKASLLVNQAGSSKAKAVTTIAPNIFYAKPRSRKGKEKAEELPDNDDDDDTLDLSLQENDGLASDNDASTSAAIIFTLDSLGGKHAKVGNVLSKYLQAEAKDKKAIDNPSKAAYKTLPVPTQPNFCDCGVYLIHFAQVFVQKADYFHGVSQKKGPRSSIDRQKDWEGQQLNGFRKRLRLKIAALSKEWRVQCTEQQEKEKETEVMKEGKAESTAVDPESSDSDIDIVDTTPVPVAQSQRKTKPRSARIKG